MDNTLWEVQNTVWLLDSYAKDNVSNLKIDTIAIKIFLGGGDVFQNEQSDPQRKPDAEYYWVLQILLKMSAA